MHGQRGRQALRDFARERRTGDHGERHVRRRAVSAATSCRKRPEPGSKPLVAQATPASARRCGASARSVSLKAWLGVTTSIQVRAGHRGGEVGAGAQRFRQAPRPAGSARSRARASMPRTLLGVAAPQRGRIAVPRQQGRQRGAPGAGAEDGDRRLGGAHLDPTARDQALPPSDRATEPCACSARRRRPSAYSASKLIGCM